MKVILNKDISNLGEEGDVIEVKRGYARNYLIPQELVMPYNEQNLAVLETHRASIEKRKEEKRRNALDLKERLETEAVNITVSAGKNGKLFGSVSNATIAEALSKLGIDIEKKRIQVPDTTIKTVGNYVVEIKLYGDQSAQVKVKVAAQNAPDEESVEEAPVAAEESAAAEVEGSEEVVDEHDEQEEPSEADSDETEHEDDSEADD